MSFYLLICKMKMIITVRNSLSCCEDHMKYVKCLTQTLAYNECTILSTSVCISCWCCCHCCYYYIISRILRESWERRLINICWNHGGWAGGWMDGYMDGWIDGWMDQWFNRWMDGQTFWEVRELILNPLDLGRVNNLSTHIAPLVIEPGFPPLSPQHKKSTLNTQPRCTQPPSPWKSHLNKTLKEKYILQLPREL